MKKKILIPILVGLGISLLTGVLYVGAVEPRVSTVPQGGTAVSYLPTTTPLVGGGTLGIRATTTLMVLTIHATSTSATSTFAWGVNITDGCFAIDGTCVGGGGGGAGFGKTWELNTDLVSISPTTTVGVLLTASSTFDRLFARFATTTEATTTSLSTTNLSVNNETFTDLTGTGLSLSGGALTLVASGDWTGTFDGQEGTYYLSRANHTGTQAASTITAGTFGAGNYAFPALLGISSSSPSQQLSLSGNAWLDSNYIYIGSTTAASTTIAFQKSATTTIPQLVNAFSISTTTSTSTPANNLFPIFSIDGLNGRVGVGTATPYALLSVEAKDGVAKLVVGTATGTNFIIGPSGNVGIRTANPADELEVSGELRVTGTGSVRIDGNSVGTITQHDFSLRVNNGIVAVFDSLTNNFGIGTTSPGRTLSVEGDVLFPKTLYLDSNLIYFASSTAASTTLVFQKSATTTIPSDLYNAFSFATSTLQGSSSILSIGTSGGQPRIGVGTSTPYAALSVNALAGFPSFVVGSTTGSTSLIVSNLGNVGIGTTTPSRNLSVAGDILVGGTATSSFTGNGVNVYSGCFSINGTCVGGGGGGVTLQGVQFFVSTTTNATYTTLSGASYIMVEVIGGGGGGSNDAKGGGGGGGYSMTFITTPAASYVYTVGGGGTGVSAGNGNTGGTSCFGTNATACTSPTLQATGGVGGNNAGYGGSGGVGTLGTVNLRGGAGGIGTGATNFNGQGGSGAKGGGGGVGWNAATGIGNGGSPCGGGGSAGDVGNNAGGTGGPGCIIIYEYK